MPVLVLASFPNSRIRPRPSTTQAFTYQVPIVDQTQPPTLVAAADLNRTYVLLKNLSLSTPLWYIYAEPAAADPTVTPTFGNLGQLVVFGGQVYQKQDGGTTVNWVIVPIETVAESVDPLQTASLDSPGSIYAAAASAVPVVPAVVIGVDLGVG